MRILNLHHLCLVIACLFFYQEALASSFRTECTPTISYNTITGEYIPILGSQSVELEQVLKEISQQNSAYCGMKVTIDFQQKLNAKWLVFKEQKANRSEDIGNHLQIKYISPKYSVIIQNAEGESLHELTFGDDLKYLNYNDSDKKISEQKLYRSWQDNRESTYANIENEANRYPEFITFLKTEILAEKNVSVPSDVLVVTPPNNGGGSKPPQGDITPSPPIMPTPSGQTGTVNPGGNPNPDKTPTFGKTEDPTKPLSKQQVAAIEYKFETLSDLISFAFCSKYSYAVMNESWFTLSVETGNLNKRETDRFQMNFQDTIFRLNDLDKNSWYTLHYPKENLEIDIAKYKRAIQSVFNDLQLSNIGGELTKLCINTMIPNFEARNRYDPGRDEYVYEEVDNRFSKEMLNFGVDLFNDFQKAEGKRQVLHFMALMVMAYDLHHFYNRLKENELPKYMLLDNPNFTMKYPKKMTTGLSLRGSAFFMLGKDLIFNDYLNTNEVSYRVTAQIGLPFEKAVGGLRNMNFYRPYLVVGVEQLNIPVNSEKAIFVGEGYTTDGGTDGEYRLATSEKINIRDESYQLGILLKNVWANHLYIDIGGGITKRFRSYVVFDKKTDYLPDPTVNLNNPKENNALERESIKPYFQLTVGRNFNNKGKTTNGCLGKANGVGVFFSAYFAKVDFARGTNFQLYQSSFDNENMEAPYVPLTGNKKWYPFFAMGIEFNMF